jgi:hypothetical protein
MINIRRSSCKAAVILQFVNTVLNENHMIFTIYEILHSFNESAFVMEIQCVCYELYNKFKRNLEVSWCRISRCALCTQLVRALSNNDNIYWKKLLNF